MRTNLVVGQTIWAFIEDGGYRIEQVEILKIRNGGYWHDLLVLTKSGSYFMRSTDTTAAQNWTEDEEFCSELLWGHKARVALGMRHDYSAILDEMGIIE